MLFNYAGTPGISTANRISQLISRVEEAGRDEGTGC